MCFMVYWIIKRSDFSGFFPIPTLKLSLIPIIYQNSTNDFVILSPSRILQLKIYLNDWPIEDDIVRRYMQ